MIYENFLIFNQIKLHLGKLQDHSSYSEVTYANPNPYP